MALSRCVYRKTVPAESQGRRIPRAVLCEISEVIMRSWDPKRTPDSYCVVYAAAVATPVAQTQSHASLQPRTSARVFCLVFRPKAGRGSRCVKTMNRSSGPSLRSTYEPQRFASAHRNISPPNVPRSNFDCRELIFSGGRTLAPRPRTETEPTRP